MESQGGYDRISLMLTLRALSPRVDANLFHEAFSWRESPRRQRMSFEDFAADDPSQIVMGLFGDDLLAVYLFCQVSPDTYDCHFTARRDAPKDAVLAAGRWLVQWFVENNLHLKAFVGARNKPLRQFVERCGFTLETLANPTDSKIFAVYQAPALDDQLRHKEV